MSANDYEQPQNHTTSMSAPPTEPPFSIFDKRQKWLIVVIVSTAANFSGFASNIYFPALPTIANDLKVSLELVNLTVTSNLIFQGIAPSLWGPVSGVKGRRIAYTCTFLAFVGACIGLAETKNYATLIVLRCLQNTGSASTIAIGSGVIGDITTRTERGGFMGIFQAGLLVPVAVGPVIGGALAGSLGWRSIFWFLMIYSAVFWLCCSSCLLGRFDIWSLMGACCLQNPSQWRGIVCKHIKISQRSNGTQRLHSSQPENESTSAVLFASSSAPIIFFLAIYCTVWQMSITAMSFLFKDRYGLTEIQIGLTFIANGVGSMVGTLITGKILDMDYRRVKAKYDLQTSTDTEASTINWSQKNNAFPLLKAHLRLLPHLSLFLFGWTIQHPSTVLIAIHIITTFITGWAAVSMQSAIMTYLVDMFPEQSAGASASVNLAVFVCGGEYELRYADDWGRG